MKATYILIGKVESHKTFFSVGCKGVYKRDARASLQCRKIYPSLRWKTDCSSDVWAIKISGSLFFKPCKLTIAIASRIAITSKFPLLIPIITVPLLQVDASKQVCNVYWSWVKYVLPPPTSTQVCMLVPHLAALSGDTEQPLEVGVYLEKGGDCRAGLESSNPVS